MNAQATSLAESEAIEDEWAARCRFWLSEYDASLPRRRRRERRTHSLILTGNGISMRVDRGALLIRDGLTHYPQGVREHRFFPGGLENPQRIILVDGKGDITLDAIDWLAEQGVTLVRLRWDGRVVSVVGQCGYAADPEKAAWQIEARKNEAERVVFGIPLIRKKLEGTLANLEEFLPPSLEVKQAVQTTRRVLYDLKKHPPKTTVGLLGLEGKAATSYFRAWTTIPIRWKRLDKHPVPEDWLTYKSRSSLRAKRVATNRRATHPVNAMLNYAYGMLEIRTRIQAIADGYDPTAGIIHGSDPNVRDAFVFDLMEAGRPQAEKRVLSFLLNFGFSASDFTQTTHGTCRVSPDLARALANDQF